MSLLCTAQTVWKKGCRSGNNPGGGWLTDFKWQAIGVPVCREHLYEGETLI